MDKIDQGKNQHKDFRKTVLGDGFEHFAKEHEELKNKYDKLIEFVKQTSIDIVHSEFKADKVKERALKLLKEIGE